MHSALKYVNIFRYTSRFNYLNNNNNSSILVELTHDTQIPLQLPNTVCLDYVCVIHINTEINLHINVTFNKIVFESIYNPTCKYGGIVAAEFLDYEYKESTTICSEQINQSRSLYSSKSSLVLILYWYKMYQKITASLTLSLTRCKPVTIDLCEFNNLCFLSFVKFYNLTTKANLHTKCNEFLNKGKWSNIIFNSDEFSGSFIHFCQENNQCSIIQFSSGKMVLLKSMFKLSYFACHAYLIPRMLEYIGNKQIEFIIKGNFGKYPRMTDHVQLLGEPEKLHIYSPQLNSSGNRFNEKIFSSCHIYAQINTSKYMNEFQIYISLLHANSWIEIIVNTISSSCKRERRINLFHIATLNFNLQYYSCQKMHFNFVLLLELGGNGTDKFIPSGVRIIIDMLTDLGAISFNAWNHTYVDNTTINNTHTDNLFIRSCN